MNDPFGDAINDFYNKGKAPDIKVNSNYTQDEKISPSWFFRTENKMPGLEKTALHRCKGKVLDVGAAAGCHSLILQKKGYNVTAMEKSELAVEVMKKRGIQKTICTDIYTFSGSNFDTILMLMNGAGIGETLNGLEKLLRHLKNLLSPKGQILMDSSDIQYLFDENDGSTWIDIANDSYYGEMEYKVKYKNSFSEFKWLFIDFEQLQLLADKCGFTCSLVEKGNHFDYLAELKLK
jgi:methylase of polypeptide subunit release factors